jgi:hypothetical protein
MTKQIIKILKKKRYKTISLKKSTHFTLNIIIFDKASENMLAVVEYKDKERLHLVEFNHFTEAQKEEVQYVLNNFDKVYTSL